MFMNILKEFKITDRDKTNEEIVIKTTLPQSCFGINEFY